MKTKAHIEVSLLQPNDYEMYHTQIEHLLREHLQATSSHIAQSIKKAFASRESDVLGGFMDGYLVAVALGSQTQSLTRRSYLLDDVVCHEQYQRSGVATQLVRVAFVQAQVRGCHRVALHSSRPGAQRFYEKLGFQKRSSQLYFWDL